MGSGIGDLIRTFRGMGWGGAVALSVVLAFGSLALAVVIIVHWPPDHFKEGARPPFWLGRHPVVRVLGFGAKNLAGIVLTLLGVVMALPGVPGQGLLLILIGMTLVDFPGKRRLERALLRRPSVLRAINGLRQRFGHPALDLD